MKNYEFVVNIDENNYFLEFFSLFNTLETKAFNQ